MAVQRTLPAKQITLNMALAVDSISFDAVRVALNLVANMQRLEMTARFFIQRLEQSGISEQRRQTVSKIDYQALREAAQNAKDLGGIKNYKRGEQAVAEFESLITPHIVLALLDEREDQSKRIAELETNLAVLAAENAGINSAIPEPRDIEDDNDNMDDVSLAEDFGFNHAIERMRKRIPETPATDAFLSEVRAQGVEMFADHLLCPDLDDTIRDFAAQLRKGVRS